ncbi:MAG TPA: hypothetical protein VEA19_04285, partial [Actinomycetota bacterium]|nr:hypothetical protein [Actinomycetota bacterium]
PYPATVPDLSSWREPVLTPAGAIAAWRLHAGDGAVPSHLRWEPLLPGGRWWVGGAIDASCGADGCQGSVMMELPIRTDTGAPETGEHPLPLVG